MHTDTKRSESSERSFNSIRLPRAGTAHSRNQALICTEADKEAASEWLKAEMNLAADEGVRNGSKANAAFDLKKAPL